MKYRAEIDGLRAFAVVPVIFYHAGFKLFSGGYTGVDVFFVISGYLITTILLAELATGAFSLIHFYERRVRRIVPALFVMMFVCLPVAWFLLLPDGMKKFSASLVAVSFFASNILFWQTSGYFDSATELKPLIHTWSLAVEEQYYILFPLFLMIVWKLQTRWIVGLLGIVFVASFAGAQWLSVTHPSFAFYMLPTRAWELLVGTFVAFYHAHGNIKIHNHAIEQCGSCIGLLLITFAFFSYDDQTPFPSIYSLAPTLGAAFIIIFATHKTAVGKLLGSKIFVYIGLISYSAYLWHQPLFAFVRERSLEVPSIYLMGALIILSFGFAYLSWRYIERPFRHKYLFTRNRVFVCGALCTALFIGVGVAGYFSRGWVIRYTDEQSAFINYYENSLPQWKYFINTGIPENFRLQCDFYDIQKYRDRNSTKVPVSFIAPECFTITNSANKTVFIWGDSHAQQLYPGIKKYLSDSWNILQVASSGCEAKLNAIDSTIDYCEKSNWFAFSTIFDTKPDVVLIAQARGHNAKSMRGIADMLQKIGIKKVIFIGPTPQWQPDLPSVLIGKLYPNIPRNTNVGVDKNVLILNEKLKNQFSTVLNASYQSITDLFCNIEGCLIYLGDDIKTGITSWDYGHLTPIASEFFSEKVLVPSIKDGFN